jgi:hypothetical protein
VVKVSAREAAAWGVKMPKTPKKRGMNKLEASYATYLEGQRLLGIINYWLWEAIKLRLADRTWYTPDFAVVTASGGLEFHETKGFMRDDANVKLKVAAEQFPWKFVLVKRAGGAWAMSIIHGKRGEAL